MKIKSAIAAIATVSATFALSGNALAGELYGGIENNAEEASTLISSIEFQAPAATFGGGELYTAANAAIDNFEASQAPIPAVVTTLAVGGELGAPATGSGVISSTTALAE